MSSRVMDKFNELIEKGTQKEIEIDTDGGGVSIDTVWLSLLVAQSEIIVLLEDIRKLESEHRSNRFELIDMSNES